MQGIPMLLHRGRILVSPDGVRMQQRHPLESEGEIDD